MVLRSIATGIFSHGYGFTLEIVTRILILVGTNLLIFLIQLGRGILNGEKIDLAAKIGFPKQLQEWVSLIFMV
jgi:hypothetical protein